MIKSVADLFFGENQEQNEQNPQQAQRTLQQNASSQFLKNSSTPQVANIASSGQQDSQIIPFKNWDSYIVDSGSKNLTQSRAASIITGNLVNGIAKPNQQQQSRLLLLTDKGEQILSKVEQDQQNGGSILQVITSDQKEQLYVQCQLHSEYFITNICVQPGCITPLCPECICTHEHNNLRNIQEARAVQAVEEDKIAEFLVQKRNQEITLLQQKTEEAYNQRNQALNQYQDDVNKAVANYFKNARAQIDERNIMCKNLINQVDSNILEYIKIHEIRLDDILQPQYLQGVIQSIQQQPVIEAEYQQITKLIDYASTNCDALCQENAIVPSNVSEQVSLFLQNISGFSDKTPNSNQNGQQYFQATPKQQDQQNIDPKYQSRQQNRQLLVQPNQQQKAAQQTNNELSYLNQVYQQPNQLFPAIQAQFQNLPNMINQTKTLPNQQSIVSLNSNSSTINIKNPQQVLSPQQVKVQNPINKSQQEKEYAYQIQQQKFLQEQQQQLLLQQQQLEQSQQKQQQPNNLAKVKTLAFASRIANQMSENKQDNISEFLESQQKRRDQARQKREQITIANFDSQNDGKNKVFTVFIEGTKLIHKISLDSYLANKNTFDTPVSTYSLDIPFKIPINHVSFSTPNSSLVLVTGGVIPEKNKNSSIKDVYQLSKDNKKLIPILNMIKPRSNHTLVCAKNRLFAIGGSSGSDESTPISSCEYLNLESMKWNEISDCIYPACGAGCTVFNQNFIYKFGGKKSLTTPVQKIERFDIVNNSWEDVQFNGINDFPFYPIVQQINQGQILLAGGILHSVKSDHVYALTVNKSNSQKGRDEVQITGTEMAPLSWDVDYQYTQTHIKGGILYLLKNPTKIQDPLQPLFIKFNGKQWDHI